MLALWLAAGAPAGAQPRPPFPFDASLSELAAAIAAGRTSSEALTRAHLARIVAIDRGGPRLNAVIAENPDAIAQARAADARRRAGRPLGPLDGVPILVKDNIETRDPMPTTAGSLALAANRTGRDAPVIARLRAAGAVILGKTNLSEWANIRSTASISGWSALGGQVRNPHALDRTPCGSSSGSGVAVAAGLAPLAIGTETDGSVVCPAAINGIVGLKPTIGLVSRTHIVPISASQDTAGPMARTVRDAAILFGAMIGADPADPVTRDADRHRRDYAAALAGASLRGVRIAVLRPPAMRAPLAAAFEAALAVLRRQGAVLVEVSAPKLDGLGEAELTVLLTELKAGMNAYLATTPPAVGTRTLAQVIAYNRAHADTEMPFFGQELFERAERTGGLDDPAYRAARAKSLRMAGPDGIDAMLTRANAEILVQPTYGAAWLIDPVYGDQFPGPSASELPAIAGYPHLTVPMGLAQGLPVGLSFIGRPYQEGTLLAAGHVYEQASRMRAVPAYPPQARVGPGLERRR